MAKAPQAKRRPATRRRKPINAASAVTAKAATASPAPEKSATAKVMGVATGVAAFTGVLTGLQGLPMAEEAPVVCGGIERWPVKVANDQDAVSGRINLTPAGPFSVAQLNQQVLPGAYPAGGRMEVEKKLYTVRGFLSYFKLEGKSGDHDYHVVITDQPGGYNEDEKSPPNGQSIIVEFPDPQCFAGKTGMPPATSPLSQAIADARATFEKSLKWPAKTRLTKPIPVTVTGVGFFDFDHHQEGRANPHPGTTGTGKVFELHPVTEISFDGEVDDG